MIEPEYAMMRSGNKLLQDTGIHHQVHTWREDKYHKHQSHKFSNKEGNKKETAPAEL